MARLKQLMLFIGLALLAFYALFPIVWLVLVSFKPRRETFTTPITWFPREFTLENFEQMFRQIQFGTVLSNSVVVAFGAALLAISIGALAGFAVSRFDFSGRRFFVASVLVFMAFPLFLLLLPLRLLFGTYGLMNTHIGLIVAYAAFYLPISIWFMKTHFDTVPRELDDSALVDGCNRLMSFGYILLPLAGPGLFSAGLIVFLLAWHEFMFAVVLIDTAPLRTLPLALDTFIQEYTIQWNRLIAASVAAVVPVIVLTMFFQRYLISAVTVGAVKDS